MQLLTKENICHKIVRKRTNATELFASEQTERRSQDAESRIQGSHRL